MEKVCIVCGEEKEIGAKDMCWACYQRERRKTYIPPPPTPKNEPCSLCGKVRRVAARRDGQPVCPTCYRRRFQPREQCAICGQIELVKARRDGQPICPTCYQRQRRLKQKDPAKK